MADEDLGAHIRHMASVSAARARLATIPGAEDYIREVVAAAPPLTPEQRDRLALLLRDGDPATDALRPLPPLVNAPQPDPTGIYRYYDRDGVLLYVGITNDDAERDSHHRRHSLWIRYVWRREAGEVLPSRREAQEAERAAIIAERPIFNLVHSTTGRGPAIEYIARHDDWHLLTLRGLGGVDRPGVRDVIADLIKCGGPYDPVLIVEPDPSGQERPRRVMAGQRADVVP